MTKKEQILVTGGAGFLGSHLCKKLLQKEKHVICVDNFFTGNKKNIEPFLKMLYGYLKPNRTYEFRSGTCLKIWGKILENFLQNINKSELSKNFLFEEGSVAFAREDEFNTEDSEFFITLKKIPLYIGEYTPVGKVIYGLEALKKIKTGTKVEYVLRPDFINYIKLLN